MRQFLSSIKSRMMITGKTPGKTSGKSKLKGRGTYELLLLAIPGILLFFIFSYLPMPGIYLAFVDFNPDKGMFLSRFVGLENFRFLFETGNAWRITRNVVLYNSAFMIMGNLVSITLALLVYEIASKRFVKFYQSLMIFPHFISWVVAAYMFFVIMNYRYGVMNQLINFFGGENINWYNEPKYWPFILILTNLWKTAGWGSILYYASLMAISKEYYEAAKIDGATKMQMTRFISIPFLYPMITLMLILGVGGMIRGDFGLFYNITRNTPKLYEVSDIIDTYVFRAIIFRNDVGMASASGFYQSIVGFILIMISNTIIRKVSPENSLF